MAHDVFISHSTKDKTISDAICAALEGAGIRCWIAPRDVRPGRSFAGEITRGIKQSKVMVLIFSSRSNNSEQVVREVQVAVTAQVHIIPFRIEDVLLSDDLQYFLGTPHWLDALSPPLEEHFERLVNAIRSLLEIPSESSATKTLSSHVPQGREDQLTDATLFFATIEFASQPGSKSEFFQRLRPMVANFVGDKADDVVRAMEERDFILSTGTGFGLASPHCYRPYIRRYIVGVISLPVGCDWEAADDKLVHTVLLYIAGGGSRSAQALAIMGAAHKNVVKVLSRDGANPRDPVVVSEIGNVVKTALRDRGLSVGIVHFPE